MEDGVIEKRWGGGTYDFPSAVDWAAVKSFRLVGGVLNLQASFDVLDGCGDEADCHPSHDARNCVAESG